MCVGNGGGGGGVEAGPTEVGGQEVAGPGWLWLMSTGRVCPCLLVDRPQQGQQSPCGRCQLGLGSRED